MGSGRVIRNDNIKGAKFVSTVSAYRFVAVAGFDEEDAIIKVDLCADNAPAYGVTPADYTAGVVEEVLVGDGAIVEIELAGSVSAGDELACLDGKAYKPVYTASLSEAYINALAEEDGVDGDVISVKLISPYKKQLS